MAAGSAVFLINLIVMPVEAFQRPYEWSLETHVNSG